MRKRRFNEEQIVRILKGAEAGTPVVDLCRKSGISDATFYIWRKKYGGMGASEARCLKSLEEENRQLKKLLAETVLENAAIKDVLARKW